MDETKGGGGEDRLEVRGAREHNLKSVDLSLPKGRLIVFTGVSGSGKSSLAFDTLFAEGQRRYIESLSSYARQFLGQLEKPAYETIRGLSPTISIEQRASGGNPRSTVGTITEVADYLRVLFARVGAQHCHLCGRKVSRQTAAEIVDELSRLPDGTAYSILAPAVQGRKGAHREVLEDVQARGFTRIRLDGEVVSLADGLPELDKKKQHTIEIVVDRLTARPDLRSRLTETVEAALLAGEGTLLLVLKEGSESLYSERLACGTCGVSFPELEPQRFSFNSPLGMCPACNGLGRTEEVDLGLLVPDPELSINEGALAPLGGQEEGSEASWTREVVVHLAEHFDIDLDRAWKDLPEKHRRLFLQGTGDQSFTVRMNGARRKGQVEVAYEGLVPQLMRRYRETESEWAREYYAGFMSSRPCSACKGARLRPESLAVRVGGATLGELGAWPVSRSLEFMQTLQVEGGRAVVARELSREVTARLRFLRDVGLGYLTLDRAAPTLSGGEAQRIRLASQIGSELTGVLYVLDEPSVGLHPADTARLLESLKRLRDLGNTVLVVEHDRDTILAADHVVDFGPGAGVNGGHVVSQGTPEQVSRDPKSLTGRYLSGAEELPVPARRREAKGAPLRILGAAANNLAQLDVELPLGCFVCVTGVSGAGKSSLVDEILVPALQNRLNGTSHEVGPHRALEGADRLDKIICIDQSPIGRTPRSNPATYVKVYDLIRRVFADLKEARVHGYDPGRFSFNVKGGRCEACHGDGLVKVEMHFLPDVYVPCDVCHGRRFNEATLQVRYKSLNIHEVLKLTVRQALDHFAAHAPIVRILKTVDEVGLGYLELGQPSPTLSGGEAQRIKLSRELAKRATGSTLYVLDEPTTGLHFDDARKLVSVLQSLVDAGNTVLVVEHNLDVVKCADHVIDLGPGGGDEGGRLVAVGTPEDLARCAASRTGQHLAALLPPAVSKAANSKPGDKKKCARPASRVRT